MEPALKKSIDTEIIEQLVRSSNIAKNMNECLWVGDRDHRTIYVNPVFEKLSGYTLEEARGKECTFFFDKKGREMIAKHHNFREKGKSSQYEASLLSKNGKEIPLLISGAPTKKGGTIGIFTNLSKLKKLGRQERIAEHIVRNSAEGIVVLDEKRKVKLWNNGATKMFGYKESEIFNKNIDLIIPENESYRNRNLIEEVEKKMHIRNIETTRKAKNGSLINVSLSVTKVTDEEEQFIGFLVIYHDITHEKNISDELQKRFEAIQDAYKELGLQKRQADYMQEIVDLAVSTSPLESLEKLIVSASCMLTKCDGAILRIFDGKRNALKLKASIGVNPQWIAKNLISIDNSLAEEAFQKKRAVIIHNVGSSQKHQGLKLIKSHGYKTLILLPLIVEKLLVGTLSLYTTDPAKFRLIEKDFLEKFAKQCSLAIYTKIR